MEIICKGYVTALSSQSFHPATLQSHYLFAF
jgi:hypothetical protein